MNDDGWEQITSPAHYNSNTMETIDLIREGMSYEEFLGYLKGNILKYICRYRYKHKEDPVKDLMKARWYIDKLINTMREKDDEK